MKIYEGLNFEVFIEDEETMFFCPMCSTMSEAKPVRVIYKDTKKEAIYHKDCVSSIIYRDQLEKKELKKKDTPKVEVGFKKDSQKIVSDKVSNNELKDYLKTPIKEKFRVRYQTNFNEFGEVEENSFMEVEAKDKTHAEEIAQRKLNQKYPHGVNSVLEVERFKDLPVIVIPKTEEDSYITVSTKPEGVISLYKDEKVALKHPYNDKLMKKYHFLNTIFFDKVEKLWICDLKKANLETLNFFKTLDRDFPQYDWSVDNDALKLLKSKIAKAKEKNDMAKQIRDLKKMEDINSDALDFSVFKISPFPYQKIGVAFLDKVEGVGFIGDEPGVGKTFSAIAYTTLKKYKTIVVCPASLKYNWQNEVFKFSSRTAQIISELDPKKLDHKKLESDYYIINYEQLEKYGTFLAKAKFDCVVLDESHYISNLQSKRTKNIFKYFKKVKSKILLSGTPIKSRPIEFYAQLKFLKPDMFSNKMAYALRYCDAKETRFGWDLAGSSNLDELNRRIGSFYIRRLKHDVLKELPDKTISIMETELSATDRKEYKRVDNEFRAYLAEQMNKFGKDYANKPLDGRQLSLITSLKQFCAKQKVNQTIDFVKNFIESTEDRKIIVFSQYIETQQKLKDAFKDIGVSIMGADSAEKRNEAVIKFQTDPKVRVFVGSTIAAGIGLNLTEADTVVFNDLLWTPAEHQQAEDRAYRIGQKNHVNIYYLIYKDTIEEKILEILNYKKRVIGEAVDGLDSMIKEEVHKRLLHEFLPIE